MKHSFALSVGILLYSLSIMTVSHAQCIEEQLNLSGNQGPNLGESLGQQFTACETGVIDKVELNIVAASNAIMKFELYNSALGYTNLIWTVDNISVNGMGPLLIDLTTGSGTTLSVVQNQTYTMRFWNTGSSVYVLGNILSSGDVYPNGAALNHFGKVQNFDPSFLDFYFRLAFNGATLSATNIDTTPIILFPNPTSGLVTINGIQFGDVAIYNMNGKLLTNKNIENGIVDISDIRNGMYFLGISSNSQTIFKKVIKN